jgi:hypothetical protein
LKLALRELRLCTIQPYFLNGSQKKIICHQTFGQYSDFLYLIIRVRLFHPNTTAMNHIYFLTVNRTCEESSRLIISPELKTLRDALDFLKIVGATLNKSTMPFYEDGCRTYYNDDFILEIMRDDEYVGIPTNHFYYPDAVTAVELVRGYMNEVVGQE